MILCPDEIAIGLDASDRRQAIARAATLLAQATRLNEAPIFRALWRREQVGSTALGNGIAIPHARIDGIARPLDLFAHTARPIEFRAPDRQPVSLLYVMLVPADGSTDAHLQRLALVAQAFSDAAFRTELAALTEPSAIRRAFAEAENRLNRMHARAPGRGAAFAAI